MKLIITLTKGEDGYIIAECPILPGCLSQGKTREEALVNIKEAIELSLEAYQDNDLPLPFEVAEIEVPVNA